jgi:putative peptidoglycan lipid II flippase
MFKSIFTNSFGILFSRILGFLRDMLQASILGANIYTDIFIVAFKLPNLFRRIFAEGAFTQSFLPSFSHSRHKSLFAVSIFVRFLLFLIFFAVIVTIFDNLFAKLIAWGFDDETIQKAAPLVAINFYYLILIFIVTFLGSLLQYKNHFATTAFATALLNIALISALLIGKDMPKEVIVYYLSYGVIIGGILQVLVHIIAIKKLHLHPLLLGGFKYLPKKHKLVMADQKRFSANFFASVVGSSTAQISAFLDGWLASFLAAGSISYLYYANRIFQFPLALFAIATSVAIFPKVTRYLKNKDEPKAYEMLTKSFWFLAALLGSAALTGIIFSKEIVWLLYERGAFDHKDSLNTAWVLTMYLTGLIPFGLAKIFSLWLYATHQQKRAAKLSGISLAVNIILSLSLIQPMGAAGLALASSLSGLVLFALTVNAFGKEKFSAIIAHKYAIYLLAGLGVLTLLLLQLKELLSDYL